MTKEGRKEGDEGRKERKVKVVEEKRTGEKMRTGGREHRREEKDSGRMGWGR
jgi:hypothetical protein